MKLSIREKNNIINNNKILLLSFLLIIISIYFSYYHGFNWLKGSLSDFGLINNFFNFSLIASGISLGIFTLTSIERKNGHWICRLFLIFSSIALIFIGIFTKKYLIHFIFAILLFSVFPFGLYFLGNHLLSHNEKLAIFTKIIGILLIVFWFTFFLIWLFIFKYGLAIPEIITLIIWVLWSVVFIKYYKPEK